MLNIPAGWKLVPIEPTEAMIVCGFESRPDPVFSKPEEWEAFDAMTGCQQAAHKARLCYAAMLAAAPTPPASAQDDTDDSIALDRLADYIADNWPDKKYGLEEICQRLHATWPGAFMSACPAPAAGDARAVIQAAVNSIERPKGLTYKQWEFVKAGARLVVSRVSALSASQQQEG